MKRVSRTNTSRRDFLKTTAAVVAGGTILSSVVSPPVIRGQNLSSKLNVASIGVGGMGNYSVQNVRGENYVGLCDVSLNNLNAAGEQNPSAQRFRDFRKMLDAVGDKLDACTVSTPDHTHAICSLAAMERGIHCYTEKPLAYTVGEVRKMIKTAAEKKLVTQMGTQIHAEPNYRRVVELIQANAIGDVTDVHVWCGTGWGGKKLAEGKFDVPAEIDWNLWIGPAPMCDYNPAYFGGNWRSFWPFGNGTLGDMACHYMDLPFWALGLRHPTMIEADGPEFDPVSCPLDLSVKYTYPKTDKHGAITLTWYDHQRRPAILAEQKLPEWGAGVLFVGTDGMLLSNYGEHHLYPTEKFQDFKRVETIPPSPGHHAEWLGAIKNGGTTSCNFDYSGTLAEAVLLGTVAYRTGKKLTWDAAKLQTNDATANALLNREWRTGW
ncbi:MAG: Gfo/Idh/MocA family oxidoreductase [Thermoguttaceae bacterium]